MEFEWDPEKAVRNIAKHGVSLADAATVFGDPLAITFYDPDHSEDEDRFLTFGQSSQGQLLVVSHTAIGVRLRALSAPGGRPGRREKYMKTDDARSEDDDLRSEYDASVLKDGVRGKYLERYKEGTNLALLAPDIRAAFPTDESVNQALRSLMQGQTPG